MKSHRCKKCNYEIRWFESRCGLCATPIKGSVILKRVILTFFLFFFILSFFYAPNSKIVKKYESIAPTLQNTIIPKKEISNKEENDNTASALWPFGPKGFICKNIALSAYTDSERSFWYKIGGCSDKK
jgi:hypothetical protein